MNFNIGTNKNEYKLALDTTDELINLYGVETKLVLVEKINIDDVAFGDYSHIKTDDATTHRIFALPENSEEWDNIAINFTSNGVVSTETINIFVSRKTINKIFTDIDANPGFSSIMGNLCVMPNGRIMEITDVKFEVPGMNNIFTHNNTKNVYKFSLVNYKAKPSGETSSAITSSKDTETSLKEDYESLTATFDKLLGDAAEQDSAASGIVEPIDDVFGKF